MGTNDTTQDQTAADATATSEPQPVDADGNLIPAPSAPSADLPAETSTDPFTAPEASEASSPLTTDSTSAETSPASTSSDSAVSDAASSSSEPGTATASPSSTPSSETDQSPATSQQPAASATDASQAPSQPASPASPQEPASESQSPAPSSAPQDASASPTLPEDAAADVAAAQQDGLTVVGLTDEALQATGLAADPTAGASSSEPSTGPADSATSGESQASSDTSASKPVGAYETASTEPAGDHEVLGAAGYVQGNPDVGVTASPDGPVTVPGDPAGTPVEVPVTEGTFKTPAPDISSAEIVQADGATRGNPEQGVAADPAYGANPVIPDAVTPKTPSLPDPFSGDSEAKQPVSVVKVDIDPAQSFLSLPVELANILRKGSNQLASEVKELFQAAREHGHEKVTVTFTTTVDVQPYDGAAK